MESTAGSASRVQKKSTVPYCVFSAIVKGGTSFFS